MCEPCFFCQTRLIKRFKFTFQHSCKAWVCRCCIKGLHGRAGVQDVLEHIAFPAEKLNYGEKKLAKVLLGKEKVLELVESDD